MDVLRIVEVEVDLLASLFAWLYCSSIIKYALSQVIVSQNKLKRLINKIVYLQQLRVRYVKYSLSIELT